MSSSAQSSPPHIIVKGQASEAELAVIAMTIKQLEQIATAATEPTQAPGMNPWVQTARVEQLMRTQRHANRSAYGATAWQR